MLLQGGARSDGYDFDGDTPLTYAIDVHHMDCVRALLGGDADVDLPDVYGKPPISHAVTADMVWRLVEYGANVDLTDGDGNTPLKRALLSRRMEVAEALLRAGCKVECVNNHGHNIADGLADHILIQFADIIEDLGNRRRALDKLPLPDILLDDIHAMSQHRHGE